MTDLLRSALHAAGGAADPGALPPPAVVRARGRARTRRTTLAAAAGAVVACSAMGVVLVWATGETPPPPQPAPSPTESTPTPDVDGPTRLTLDTGQYRFSAHAVASHEGRLVVVGDSSDLVVATGPPVYWSDDGVVWHPAAAGEAPESVNVTDVVATDSGFVAVGIGSHDAAAWHSRDGAVWTPVPVEKPEGPSRSSMWGIVRTGPVLYATGFHAGRARLWSSEDGASWVLATGRDTFDVPGRETICAIRDTADGLVATGVAVPEGSLEGRTVTWTSVDGSSWSRSDEGGERALWCDSTRDLGHWEARTDTVKVEIDPYGPGDVIEVTPLAD